MPSRRKDAHVLAQQFGLGVAADRAKGLVGHDDMTLRIGNRDALAPLREDLGGEFDLRLLRSQ
jgi:hypothetical protein